MTSLNGGVTRSAETGPKRHGGEKVAGVKDVNDFMRISAGTAVCFVGVIFKTVGAGRGGRSVSVPTRGPGIEWNVRSMALVPDKANTLDGGWGLCFQNRFEGFMCCFLRVCACVRGRNEVSHESQHLTNKPRTDTLNCQKPPTFERKQRRRL